MFTHKQVWAAIDTIAERYGFSASGLAKKSGLDPTWGGGGNAWTASGNLPYGKILRTEP